jgi:hypothetical protein
MVVRSSMAPAAHGHGGVAGGCSSGRTKCPGVGGRSRRFFSGSISNDSATDSVGRSKMDEDDASSDRRSPPRGR